MKDIIKVLFALLVPMTMLSCGDSEYEYTTHVCYFVFDNSTHQDPTLATAMNASAPGVFCVCTIAYRNGATYFDFKNNQGNSSSQLADAIDQRRTQLLGYNGGLIVGYGNLSSPMTFYAFDRECPNCFSPDALPMKSYPLSISSAGIATCAKCKREYNMNIGGIISSGDKGNKMTRYRGNTTGPYGVLTVN